MGRKRPGRRIKKVKLSRIGSYAIASSIKDPASVSCTTFNILAPIYKRLNQEDPSYRESDVKDCWLDRNQRILDWLLCERSSIICLQEFWVGNEELVSMYDKRLGDAGYINFKLARTNNRGDGLLTAVRKDQFRVINHRGLLFNDFGDRVAQLLHAELIVKGSFVFVLAKTIIMLLIILIKCVMLTMVFGRMGSHQCLGEWAIRSFPSHDGQQKSLGCPAIEVLPFVVKY